MPQLLEDGPVRIGAWQGRVASLLNDIENWSTANGWSVEREQTTIEEERIGTYAVPMLIVRLGQRSEFHVTPISLETWGGKGRVDLVSFPFFSRVKLLEPSDGHGWTIMTDSNIPLRQPWCKETFDQLIADMTV